MEEAELDRIGELFNAASKKQKLSQGQRYLVLWFSFCAGFGVTIGDFAYTLAFIIVIIFFVSWKKETSRLWKIIIAQQAVISFSNDNLMTEVLINTPNGRIQ